MHSFFKLCLSGSQESYPTNKSFNLYIANSIIQLLDYIYQHLDIKVPAFSKFWLSWNIIIFNIIHLAIYEKLSRVSCLHLLRKETTVYAK